MTPEKKGYTSRVTLRLPDEIRRKLQHQSIDVGVTLNAYIVHVLISWLEANDYIEAEEKRQ